MGQCKTSTYQRSLVECVVHRPTLDDNEREKREAALLRAVTAYGKAIAKRKE